MGRGVSGGFYQMGRRNEPQRNYREPQKRLIIYSGFRDFKEIVQIRSDEFLQSLEVANSKIVQCWS